MGPARGQFRPVAGRRGVRHLEALAGVGQSRRGVLLEPVRPSATSSAASARRACRTASWRDRLTTTATVARPTTSAATRARRHRRRRRSRSTIAPREALLHHRELPRVALAPQLELLAAPSRSTGGPGERPFSSHRCAACLSWSRRTRPLLVLGLPAHEAGPGLQERLVDDLDPVVGSVLVPSSRSASDSRRRSGAARR